MGDKPLTKQEQVREAYRENPCLSQEQLKDAVGCSIRTVRYALGNIEDDLALVKHDAKILLFDLETSPLEVFSWGIWKQVINPGMIIKDWSILSWSAKWLMASRTKGMVVTPAQARAREDKDIVTALWHLMDEADIIIAHNAVKFDVKKMNARFILNGLPAPSPYRVVDTLTAVRGSFAFTSNKLDYVNQLLGVTQKLDHAGFSMWRDCVRGTEEEATKALKAMLAYNKVDIKALEELYLMIRPWIKFHPNVNLYQEFDEETNEGAVKCTNCGSENISWHGKYYTPGGRFKSYTCECGARGRSRYSDITLTERKTLGMNAT